LFHPMVAQWFTEQIGEPTGLQQKVWPRVSTGEHVLITAPTGSGKTLAAFLWAINELVTGKWSLGHAVVLYVSPLKALNNDIQRNLLGPLVQLKHVFTEAGEPFPHIRVFTRSGDTPQSDRRRMQRHTPEILITTPESLNLLLSSAGGRSMLMGISTVILDEIHAVVSNKRGVHLITAVDRLVQLSGEFQRIALSATLQPIQVVAEFVGGCRLEGDLHDPLYVPRPVSVVSSSEKKKYELRVRFPGADAEGKENDAFWDPYVDEIKGIIAKNRSTLLFTNSRRLCEKLTYLINLGETRPIAYAHHGSLSREIREEVERKFKVGELRAIVATNSLELGIDIGVLDEVVLIQSPPSVSSAIQRIGRAGHHVGHVSRGTLFPTHSMDVLEAAALASGVPSQDIESVRPVQSPLDVLAQVIISMVGIQPWNIDALYGQLKTSYPYRSLSREHFDLVLNMLAGHFADSRIRELVPRISIDRLDNTVAARKGALQALYISGGTIPDRGYFHLRHQETNAKIGELDEEFVWEASVGKSFTLGTQSWKIERITHNDVFVLPRKSTLTMPPFWKGEESLRDYHFSKRISKFLEEANDRLDDPALKALFIENNCMDEEAAERLIVFLKTQRDATGCPLPHRHHIVVEFVSAGPGGYPGNQVVFHTLWGGQVNRPFAMALEAAWEDRFGYMIEVYVSNDCIMLLLPHEVIIEEVISLVTSTNVLSLLKKRLEGSGFFGARFRECAGRALLVTRRKVNERMPLWLNRLRSQRLLDAVLKYEDFPILLESWRTCLRDEFDLDALIQVLTELESGSIAWTETRTSRPSPMARSVTWRQINEYMYMDDQTRSGKRSMLRGDLLRDVVFADELRPAVSSKIIEMFESKRTRLSPGYSPETSGDLLEWVKERVLMPHSEWKGLLQAMRIDHDTDPELLIESIAHKLACIRPAGTSKSLIVALEMLPRIIYGLYGSMDKVHVVSLDAADIVTIPSAQDVLLESEEGRDGVITSLVGEWLQFYGPKTVDFISGALGLDKELLDGVLEDLTDSERLLRGKLVKESREEYVCDIDNYEILLRLMRAGARPAFEPLGIEWLPVFLAQFHGITDPEDHIDGLFRTIEQLVCYPAPAALWEAEIFPARLHPYRSSWLDTIIQQTSLRWIGTRNHRIYFLFDTDMDFIQEEIDNHEGVVATTTTKEPTDLSDLFPDPAARYDFSTLLRISKLRPGELAERLWNAVWQGQVSNDTFASLRRGVETGFKVTEVSSTALRTLGRRRHSSGRTAFSQWKGSVPFAGNWQKVSTTSYGDDLIEAEERNKDKAQLLLDRYGIVFRELLQNELPAFRWAAVFRALRLMELSGEVLNGYFFHGVPGPQFISHEAFRMLQRKIPDDVIYWISAMDPASLCGIRLDALKGTLPRRAAGAHMVYRGSRLVLVSQRRGRTLTFHVPPDDPRLLSYLGFLRHLLFRPFNPLRRIIIEDINGEDAAQSPYVDIMRTGFDVIADYKNIILYRREI
jgi:ATP-dependent Lhr-like helicase